MRALAVSGGDLYAAGGFWIAGGKVSPYLAKADFGTAATGGSSSLEFTVGNTGTAELTGTPLPSAAPTPGISLFRRRRPRRPRSRRAAARCFP